MKCPYCLLDYNNGHSDDKHEFIYIDDKYWFLLIEGLHFDTIGYSYGEPYINNSRTTDKSIDIYPFEIKDAINIINKFNKLGVFI